MSTKQKLKRAYINVGYPRHADILSLTYKFGITGKCASYDLILAMSDASNGVIDKDAFLYTCKINEVSDPESFLAYCIEKRIFIEVTGGYSNSIVIKDQESYARKLSEDKERKRNKIGIQAETDRKLDIDIDNVIDTGSDPNKLDIALPEFQTPKILSATENWAKHRRKLGKSFDQGALDSMLRLYEHRPNELAEDIDHSITNGWKTLNAKSRDTPRKEKKSTKDTINEIYQAALLEEQNAKNRNS